MKKMCHCGTYLSMYIIKRDTHYVRLHFPVILIVFYPASRNKTSASLEQLQFLWEHLLPSSGHETVLMTYRTVEVIQLLGRNSTCHLSSALSSHPLPAHWLWLIILFTICPPSLSSPLFPAFSLIVSHHDSIHNVILVVFQRTDGFGSWHIGLSHHQLNVSLLKASLIHLMYRKKERSKDKERFQNICFNGCWNRYSETIVQKIPLLLPLHSPPWWWGWVGQVGLREKRSQAPWISLQLLCEPAETGPQSEERKGPNK